jgi:hypothetical protein
MRNAAGLACVATAAAIGSTVTYLLARPKGPPSPPVGTVVVEFGKPTKMVRMTYAVLYDKKPFPDAVLLYYDNGVYAILSEGENHYGTYVLEGGLTDRAYTAHFISLPSTDWNGKSVYHELRFDTAEGTFAQQLTNPDDPDVPRQTGTFTLHDNTVIDPTWLDWRAAQSLGR